VQKAHSEGKPGGSCVSTLGANLTSGHSNLSIVHIFDIKSNKHVNLADGVSLKTGQSSYKNSDAHQNENMICGQAQE
jgi:hypothetical protein